jgi:hypothetical protein
MAGNYEFIHNGDGWVNVSGSCLPEGLRIRVALKGERLHVVGVYLQRAHLQNGIRPITSADLRRIPLSSIVSEMWSDLLDQQRRAAFDARSAFMMMAYAYDPLDADLVDEDKAERLGAMEAQFGRYNDLEGSLKDRVQSFVELGESIETASATPRPRGAAPATDLELKTFAGEYLAQIRNGMRGAVTRTARARSISRSTVYRWIEQCRERGFLPSEGEL